jgi:hypothetical protein
MWVTYSKRTSSSTSFGGVCTSGMWVTYRDKQMADGGMGVCTAKVGNIQLQH